MFECGDKLHFFSKANKIFLISIIYIFMIYRGNMACTSLFDSFIDDLDKIAWDPIVEKCFGKFISL